MIILMFFMSSAFETKILSLMASKPAIQRIKTLADLLKSDVKFYFDVEANPHYKERMIIGDRIFQGDELIYSETIPGVGTLCRKEFVQLLEQIAFDSERNQPFYVVLDYEYYDSPECIDTVWRFIYRQTFITMHGWLVQAGLMEKWKQQWMDKMRSEHIGRRYREDTRFKADLSFDDIKPAWVLLMAGLGISLVTVLAEHGASKFDRKRFFECMRILSTQASVLRKRCVLLTQWRPAIWLGYRVQSCPTGVEFKVVEPMSSRLTQTDRVRPDTTAHHTKCC